MLPARMARAKMLTARMRWRSIQPPDQRSARSLSSFLSKAISYAVERLDRLEFGVDRAEFAPQALDVAVDGPVVDIDVVLIGDVHQLVARFDHAGPLGERLEDHELGHRQGDVPAVPAYPVPRRIHGEPPAHDLRQLLLLLLGRRRRPGLGAAQDRPDPRDQQALRE